MTEEELQRAFKILDEVLEEFNIPNKPSSDGITRIDGMTVDEYFKKYPLWDRDYNLIKIQGDSMREILFRGKVYDTTLEYKKGDWVFGNLIEMNDTHECYIRLKERRFYVKVDPNTVSQFTGVIDSCKQKVFEGDIIQTIEEKPIVGIVKWYKYESRFIIESNVKDKEIGAFSVIGNIWDRKKLKDEIKMSAVILRTVDGGEINVD